MVWVGKQDFALIFVYLTSVTIVCEGLPLSTKGSTVILRSDISADTKGYDILSASFQPVDKFLLVHSGDKDLQVFPLLYKYFL